MGTHNFIFAVLYKPDEKRQTLLRVSSILAKNILKSVSDYLSRAQALDTFYKGMGGGACGIQGVAKYNKKIIFLQKPSEILLKVLNPMEH